MSVHALDTTAQAYVRSLPKTATGSAQKKAELEKRKASEGPGEIQQLEEIKVRDRLDPEDYVAPKPAPMLVFRARLDAQRPMTPWEIVKAICIICPNSAGFTEASNIADRTQEIAKNPRSFAFIR